MDKNSNSFTVMFAAIVCVVLAVCLAATYNGLIVTIKANAKIDKQTNVLIAMGFYDKSNHLESEELEDLYQDRVEGKVLEVKRDMVETEIRRAGVTRMERVEKVVDVVETEHQLADLPLLQRAETEKPADEQREYVAIYRGVTEDGKAVWCIPISGYGLWSTLYGFLALEEDLNTVRGITFYSHKETPGLGGEVDNVAWQQTWPGKTILDSSGRLVGVALKKGVVDQKVEYEKMHAVDGLAGATITSNGVTTFVKAGLETYGPYFAKHR